MRDLVEFRNDIGFESERLRLVPIDIADLDKLFDWRCSPHVCAYSRTSSKPTRAEHEMWFKNYLDNPHSLRMMIVSKDTGRGIGIVACDVKNNEYELSYYLGDPDAQGKGYMLEALKAFVASLHSNYFLTDLIAEVRTDNVASVVLLDKLGGVVTKEYDADEKTWLQYAILLTDEEIR